MLTLLDLSGEVFERALLMLDDLGDIARVSQTCRAIHDLVYKSADSHLWRSLFLARYDDPRSGLGVKSPYDYNWKRAVQARTKAQKVVASSTVTPDHVEAITTLLTLSADAPHGAIVTGRNIPLLHSLITPALYARSDRPLLLSDQALLSPLDASEASAKLSVYLGLGAEPRRTLSRPSQRNGARAIVYDLRTWQEDCLYGPFKPDGTIDWRKAEAILFVACANAIDLVRSLNASARTRLSCHLAGARPYSAPGWDDDSITGDWAGVTGSWRRCINFCDWSDLQRYQHAVTENEGARFFATRFAGEAVRILNVHLEVVAFEPNSEAPLDRPTIIFEGSAEGGSPHEARVFGRVWMNKLGEVCWKLTSRYGGHDRWYSVGAQIGGVRSAYGVLGVWSGLDHDFENGDPAGPFLLWKVDAETEPDPHEIAAMMSEEEEEEETASFDGLLDLDGDLPGDEESEPGLPIQDVLAFLNGELNASDLPGESETDEDE